MEIIHLEDSALDAELIQDVLRACWSDCRVTTIKTREAFEQAVLKGNFDLILSDFSLPGYSGLSALAFAQAHCPEKPFIYLSGTIGEERAVAALKAGATDYVVKDRPARLIPAISAALVQIEQAEAHRRAEEKIREQASLLDKSREAICVINAEGCVTYWNASAERLYGWNAQEAAGRSLRDLLYTHDLARFDTVYALVLANGEWRGELCPQPRDGESALVEGSWSLVTNESGLAKSILIVDTDITARRRIENQLQQSQRLETLGLLVGGIAHDLNNMLAPIITSVSLLRERATCVEDGELLDILNISAHDGADLVRQLLAFARGGSEQRSETAIDALIGSVRKLLQRAMPANVTIQASLNNELWPVLADPTQLRQVLLNLCMNARDAMPEGGTIEISARDVEIGPAATSIQGEVEPGPYVRISVADTGTGIPPEIIQKIFTPFFTTKQAGKGTGLGLANVAGIVKSHGGFLDLESTPGLGTTFHIHLPASAREKKKQAAATVPHLPMQGHGERILIIEDDDDIRTVLDIILNTRGYIVTMAATGEEGLAELYTQPDAFDLVITDLNMPGMGGREVIRQVRAMPNPPKLVVISGLPCELQEMPEVFAGVEFLRKPITVEGLLGTVRHVVEAPHHNTPNGRHPGEREAIFA